MGSVPLEFRQEPFVPIANRVLLLAPRTIRSPRVVVGAQLSKLLDCVVPLQPPWEKPTAPLMSASTTEPNEGRPAAFPCRTVVVVPELPIVWLPCEPAPTTGWLEARGDAEVTQVGQVRLPVVELRLIGEDAPTANVPDVFGRVSVGVPAAACA